MNAATVRQAEDEPVPSPAAPAGLSDKAAAIEPAVIWQRLESWIAYRFAARDVTWIVEGPGSWSAPLAPATVTDAYQWDGTAWVAYTLPADPFGYELPAGHFKVVATVGGGDVPAAVAEAYRRLAEYSAEIGAPFNTMQDAPGASSYSSDIGGELQESFTRPSTWAARALHYSGAADLLRPYRRAK
jgi:hypothetical protein